MLGTTVFLSVLEEKTSRLAWIDVSITVFLSVLEEKASRLAWIDVSITLGHSLRGA